MKRYTFGSYPHDDIRKNITWLILEQNGNEAKMISEYVLDACYFSRSGENVWEDSFLREWLQSSFVDRAFTEEQQEALVKELCECEQWDGQEVIDIDYSFDNVTLLSLDELREYFPTDDARIAKATQYAQDEGAEIEYAADCCGWWLRSPGMKAMGLSSWNACVMANGTVKPWGIYTESIGVRPVITVNLDLAASCQYDMVEDDDDSVVSDDLYEDFMSYLQMRAGNADDDEEDDAEDGEMYDEDDEEESFDAPVVLKTITGGFQFNKSVYFHLPAGMICEESVDEDGNMQYQIKAGEYIDDDGDTCWNLQSDIYSDDLEPDDAGHLPDCREFIDNAVSNLENDNYIEIRGAVPAVIVTRKTPFNIARKIPEFFVTALFVPWAEGKVVRINEIRSADCEVEQLKQSFGLFLELAKGIRVNGSPLALDALDEDEMLRKLVPSFADDEEGVVNMRIRVRINGQDTGSIVCNTDGTVSTQMVERFPQADPPGYLYAHYAKVQPPRFAQPNVTYIVNSGGTEFDPVSLESVLEENDSTGELLRSVRNYKRSDTYTLHERAKKIAEVFRVDRNVFDTRHDRLCEILTGNLQKCYTLSALRSFAWTLGLMAEKSSRSITDYSEEELNGIIEFAEGQRWLNYKPDGGFKSLCDQPDLHVMYVPDDLCTERNSKNLRETLAQMPVASLNELRKCLIKLQPVMEKLAGMLSADRDHMQPLTGNAADVLYAWCALCIAAKEPFYIEDGPMVCFWDYPGGTDHGKYHADTKASEQPGQEKPPKMARWLDAYGGYISNSQNIIIYGKRFVFTGLGERSGDQKAQVIVQEIEARGGLHRKSISGVTDYLVVGDDEPGETKIKEAIAQQKAGKPIQIIRLKDLEAALDEKLPEESNVGEDEDEDDIDSLDLSGLDPEKVQTINELLDGASETVNKTYEMVERYMDLRRVQEEEDKRCEQNKLQELKNVSIDTNQNEADMYAALWVINELDIWDRVKTKEAFFEIYGEDFPACDQSELWELRQRVDERSCDETMRTAYEQSFLKQDAEKRFSWIVLVGINVNPAFDINERFETAMKMADRWFAVSEHEFLQKKLQETKEDFRRSIRTQFMSICDEWLQWTTAKPLLFVEYKDRPSPYDSGTLFKEVNDKVVTLRLRDQVSGMLVTQVLNWYIWYWGISAEEAWLTAYKNRFDQQGYPLKEDYLVDETEDMEGTVRHLCKALDEMGIQYRSHEQQLTRSALQPQSDQSNTYEQNRRSEYTSVPQKKEGCYIATAVYGSYDAPEVMVLRRFRDDTLRKSALGRWFIRVYYRLSPAVAKKLRKAKRVNGVVRKCLDRWVRYLER